MIMAGSNYGNLSGCCLLKHVFITAGFHHHKKKTSVVTGIRKIASGGFRDEERGKQGRVLRPTGLVLLFDLMGVLQS